MIRLPLRWGAIRASGRFVVLMFLSVTVLVGIDQAIGPNLLTAIAALVSYVLLSALLYRFEPTFFLLSFLFIFGQFGALLSGVLIESGAYISEQQRTGFLTGATVWLCFYTTVFILVAYSLFQLFDGARNSRAFFVRYRVLKNTRILTYALLLGVIVFVFIGLFINGSPLLEHRDRFSYWRFNTVPLLQPIHNQLSTLIFALGLCFPFTRSRGERNFAFFLLLITLVYFVLQGEKYTALVLVTYSFLLPILMRVFAIRRRRPSIKQAAIVGLVTGGILIPLILYQYSGTFRSDTPITNLIQRVVLQGHVWWGTYDHYLNGTLPVEQNVQSAKELAALFSFRPADDTGMSYLMRVVSPEDLVARYKSQGIRFTMGYPAIGLAAFGQVGLIALQIVAAILFVAVAGLLLRSVRAARVLLAVVGYKLLFELNGVFGMGNLHELLTLKTALYVALAFVVAPLTIGARDLARFAKATTKKSLI